MWQVYYVHTFVSMWNQLKQTLCSQTSAAYLGCCSLCAPGENTTVISWDKSQWCVMVPPLWLAFTPTVRPGSLLHYLKNQPPISASKPLQASFPLTAENKTVNLCLQTRREGEPSSKLKTWTPVEKVPRLVSSLCRTDSSSPVCSTSLPLSAEGTELLCNFTSCVGSILSLFTQK